MSLPITGKSLFCPSVTLAALGSSEMVLVDSIWPRAENLNLFLADTSFLGISVGQRCVLSLEIPQREMMTLASGLFLS